MFWFICEDLMNISAGVVPQQSISSTSTLLLSLHNDLLFLKFQGLIMVLRSLTHMKEALLETLLVHKNEL